MREWHLPNAGLDKAARLMRYFEEAKHQATQLKWHGSNTAGGITNIIPEANNSARSTASSRTKQAKAERQHD